MNFEELKLVLKHVYPDAIEAVRKAAPEYTKPSEIQALSPDGTVITKTVDIQDVERNQSFVTRFGFFLKPVTGQSVPSEADLSAGLVSAQASEAALVEAMTKQKSLDEMEAQGYDRVWEELVLAIPVENRSDWQAHKLEDRAQLVTDLGLRD